MSLIAFVLLFFGALAGAKRLTSIMRDQGWRGPKPMRIGAMPVKGYSRPLPQPWD
jgi:hypothetical protein